MNTRHPELINVYVERPEPETWLCLACDADARDRGFSSSVAAVTDKRHHTQWHEDERTAR